MSGALSSKDWLSAIVLASKELAAMGLGQVRPVGSAEHYPENTWSAYVPLSEKSPCLHIGIAALADDCTRLAGKLLEMSPQEERYLSDEDIADALSELANILAGNMKRALQDRAAGLAIGVPVFLKGDLDLQDVVSAEFFEVQVGQTPVTFVVVSSKNPIRESGGEEYS